MIIQDISVKDCVHYRGFRYGGFGHNIYEDYILGLANNIERSKLRALFTRRVLAYKGGAFSEALNVKLSRKYASWNYPWTLKSAVNRTVNQYSPAQNPDIICHYSQEGILASHINREFFWLERAYETISSKGYKPELYGYINLVCLRKRNEKRYLVVDGNHRISALHSLGISRITANVTYPFFWSKNMSKIWPGVIANKFVYEDAVAIFERYFINSNLILPESEALHLIEDEKLLT